MVLARVLAERHARHLMVDPVLLHSRLRRLRGVTPRSLSPLVASALPVGSTPWHHRAAARLAARWPAPGLAWVLNDAKLQQAAMAGDLSEKLGTISLIRTHGTHPALFAPAFEAAWRSLATALEPLVGVAPPTLALHVRRGDYLNPNSGFLPLGPGYYRRALETVRKCQDLSANAGIAAGGSRDNRRPLVHLFTDDPAWCRTHLTDSDWDLQIEAGSPEQDLARLAASRVLIISNSSFSAVASHLAKLRDPAAAVLCPDRWLLKEDGRLGDLRSPGWLTVKV